MQSPHPCRHRNFVLSRTSLDYATRYLSLAFIFGCKITSAVYNSTVSVWVLCIMQRITRLFMRDGFWVPRPDDRHFSLYALIAKLLTAHLPTVLCA